MYKLMIVCKHLMDKKMSYEVFEDKPMDSKDSGITAVCVKCLEKKPNMDNFKTVCEHCFKEKQFPSES